MRIRSAVRRSIFAILAFLSVLIGTGQLQVLVDSGFSDNVAMRLACIVLCVIIIAMAIDKAFPNARR